MEKYFFAGLLLLASCGPLAELQEETANPDLTPPVLQSVRLLGEEVELTFDEPPSCDQSGIRTEPPLAVSGLTIQGNSLRVGFAGQVPGVRYSLELTVSDAQGNSLSLITEFYGLNPLVPRLLINEFTPRGTETHPDLVELRALSEGDLAGVVIYEGTYGNWDDRLILPALSIHEGEFILVHFKPQGIAEETDENSREAIAQSGGLDASATAFDFWVPGGDGLGGNNGVLSLYDRPGGALLDGVLYSNRTSASDTLYRGFGTADTLARAEELVREGGWSIAEGQVRPEDAVSPEGSAGTRSLCRSSLSADTDSAADWHIVPTRGATFGGENSDEIYVP